MWADTYALPTRSLRAPYAERAVTVLDFCEVHVSANTADLLSRRKSESVSYLLSVQCEALSRVS